MELAPALEPPAPPWSTAAVDVFRPDRVAKTAPRSWRRTEGPPA